MPKTAYLSHDVYLTHLPPVWHPDSPARLACIADTLRSSELWERVEHLRPRRASEDELARVHTRGHIERMRAFGARELDPDTYASEGSFEAACFAAGAVIEAVDRCRDEGLRRAFCSVRPPGHHAETDHAAGFCIFNNVAVGAAHALARGCGRVLIVDFDAHHGNGTQHIFEEDDRVLYFSTHQFPYYPETGRDSERGRGKGEGFTYNVPVLAGSGNKDYLTIYQDILPGVARRFAPDIVIVSAGYDIHASDMHANIRVTDEGVRGIVRGILDCADAPMVFALEGGYDLPSLAESVRITIEEMLRG